MQNQKTSPVSKPGIVASRSMPRMDQTNMRNTGRLTSGVDISPSGWVLSQRKRKGRGGGRRRRRGKVGRHAPNLRIGSIAEI